MLEISINREIWVSSEPRLSRGQDTVEDHDLVGDGPQVSVMGDERIVRCVVVVLIALTTPLADRERARPSALVLNTIGAGGDDIVAGSMLVGHRRG